MLMKAELGSAILKDRATYLDIRQAVGYEERC